MINRNIQLRDWNWTAEDNSLVAKYYFEKAIIFAHKKYNLQGMEYYVSGVFKCHTSHENLPDFNSLLPRSFDWRDQHDARMAGSKYDFGPDGWLTRFHDQKSCGSCWAFSTVNTVEAVMNLYYNQKVDYTLSEQDLICNVYNSCVTGGPVNYALSYFSSTGVIDSICLSYGPWEYDSDECLESLCPNPDYKVKITNNFIADTNADVIKRQLMENGPLTIGLNLDGQAHAMCLTGYKMEEDNTTTWIFKNSWSNAHYKEYNGSALDFTVRRGIIIPVWDMVDSLELNRQCFDKDKDGYYNWGIGGKPPQNFSCSNEEDWNDNNNRIGPRDENFNGIAVKPEMHVTVTSVGTQDPPIPLNNKGFYFLNSNPETIIVHITNPGTAQLNLVSLSPSVTIIEDGTNYFHIVDEIQPFPHICMNNIDESTFSISFNAPGVSETRSAIIRIQLDSRDSDVYEFFEFELVGNGCGLSGQALHISGYKKYIGYNLILNDIYIDNGGVMEVFGSLAMNQESDIVVNAGGKLIVNGGLITSSCANLWHGIDIWGNANQPQTLEFQGMVSVINSGCIEYAQTAIETVICPGCEKPFPTGGIVSCSDAIFKDNLIDVKFYPYNNTHPVTHQLVPNISSFTKTIFETTEDLYKLNFGIPSAHIYMNQVGGIRYTACSFGNYSAFHSGSRGKGIESYGAGYFVSYGCAEEGISPCPSTSILPCRFENLDYGIRSFNNYGFYNVNISTAEFIQNRRGMYLGAVNNAVVIRNTFDISDPQHLQPNDTLVGLYLDAFTTGFVVEENIFTGPGTFSLTVGIHLLNTGTNQNEIYNNTFTTLKQGIMAVGTNRLSPIDLQDPGKGLCIKCNDFSACNTDVYVMPVKINGNFIVTKNTGIAQQQGELGYGDKTKAAGNTFSDVSTKNYLNIEGCGLVKYTYHGFGTPPDYLIPDYYGDLALIPDLPAKYSKAESCPSHIGGSINLSAEKNSLINETNLIDDYKDSLLLRIDGGNTVGLNYEILTSFPEEALVIRQELIGKSPYLSDTVMISAIEKEEVLPGAMVRDILVANPQAPKSKKIINALDQRQDTIPDYMMGEIMQGLDTYGAKELLEQKLGSHVAKKEKAWTNLNLYYKNDTANYGQALDSLMVLYQNENKLDTRYDLAFLYLDKIDSVEAFNILNSIPNEFDLDDKELLIHDQYQDLFDIIWDMKNDSIGLDSTQIQTLFELSFVPNSFPGIFASNLLIKGISKY